jgi:hypothetical protein
MNIPSRKILLHITFLLQLMLGNCQLRSTSRINFARKRTVLFEVTILDFKKSSF